MIYKRNIDEIKKMHTDAFKYHSEQYGSFKKWAQNLKEGTGRGSGLLLYTTVGSLEEGEKLWNDWNKAWA